MAFTQKILSADFSLGMGVFSGGGNTSTVTGLRMSAHITTAGGDDAGNLELAIFGMTLSDMNQLTTLPAAQTAIGVNTIILSAGDDPNGLAVVFQGNITVAYVDGTSQPDVAFRVSAYAAHVARIKPAAPTSVNNPAADVSGMMKQLAGQMGYGYEDGGVKSTIAYPYLPGAILQQVSALARHTGVEWTLDGNTLAVWPSGQARNIAPTTISPQTGMVGYPAFTASGLILTTLYQGTLKFGAPITVQSSLQAACGNYFVHFIEYDLECQMPNGKWFAILQASKIDPNADNS